MNRTIDQQLAEIRNNMLAITQNQTEKTMTQPQTQTQPQTIQVKINPRGKGTMSAQVRKLMREQPQMSAIEIAKIVGCKPHTVHNVKYQQRLKKRKTKTIQVKPRAEIKTFGELSDKAAHDLLNSLSRGRNPLAQIKHALTNFTMDLIASNNTDLLKNKHFQTLVKLTTTSENTQL